MARPTKSIDTTSGHFTKEEIKSRQDAESKLKGKADKVKPSDYLSERQREIFTYIVDELKASGILSNLDVFILDACAVAIDRLQYIENLINEQPEMLFDKGLMSAKDKYIKDLYRTSNELSLSPQSRAKLGNINVKTSEVEQDPLLKALKRVK
jgi:P27 family predicted phage terminase small subunit